MTLEEFRQLFRMAPERYPENLETRYPRILKTVLEKWGSPLEEERYLSSLVVDLRGSRQGFPPEVMNELLFISELYQRWRADRRRKADESKLKPLSANLVSELESRQKRLTPDLQKNLTKLAVMISKDDPASIDFMSSTEIHPNQKDIDGKTPLMHASVAGAEKVLLALIQLQANPHIQDSSGNTALHWAVVKGRLRIVEILLYFGANTDVKNKSGASPFSLSAVRSDVSIAQRLIDYGADTQSFDNDGNTPLHRAVMSQNSEAVWLLLTFGASKEARNRAGMSPSDLAEAQPNVKLVFDKYRNMILQQAMSDR